MFPCLYFNKLSIFTSHICHILDFYLLTYKIYFIFSFRIFMTDGEAWFLIVLYKAYAEHTVGSQPLSWISLFGQNENALKLTFCTKVHYIKTNGAVLTKCNRKYFARQAVFSNYLKSRSKWSLQTWSPGIKQ